MSLRRRVVRERVLQALYAYELSHEPIQMIIENIIGDLQKQPESLAFAKQLILKVIECTKELDVLIRQRVEHWEFNRLAIIDRIVLRMSICELLYFEDIPPKVTMNEAIEIARAFSTDKSDKFVNGGTRLHSRRSEKRGPDQEIRARSCRYNSGEKILATMSIAPSRSSSLSATRGQVISWALFDFANTAFYVLILTVGYPLYFKEIVIGGSNRGDFLWGSAFSISMCIVALISPVLGAVADYGAGKKRFLALFTALCIIATALLFFVHEGMIAVGMILLISANIGFEAGLVFYDAFLPEITTERSYGRVSGYGFALGYVGSLVTLAVVYPLYINGFGPSNLFNIRFSFLIAAAFFFVFSLPIFLFLPDKQQTARMKLDFIRIGFARLRTTYQQLPRFRNIAQFLISYFIYIDGINTIIVFSSIFAMETLKMEISEIVIYFAMVQTSAILGSILFGVLSDHTGHKRTLSATLLLWLSIVVIAYFIQDKWLFYAVGILAGLALGSSQSTSRGLMSIITPQEKRTEFFGFYSFFGKASAILGPLMFGFISSYFNQRLAILSIGLLLLVGLILLQRVEEHSPENSSSIT